MNAAKRAEIFRRLHDDDPNPTTELEYASPFELLIAVILSAQATDVGVNKATAKLYAVQMQTGYAAINFSTGTALSSTDSSVTRSTTIGSGIASMPVIIVTPPPGSGNATASALTATTNQQLPNNPIPAPSFLKQVRSWRERIQ